eukprot:s1822_g11.t1
MPRLSESCQLKPYAVKAQCTEPKARTLDTKPQTPNPNTPNSDKTCIASASSCIPLLRWCFTTWATARHSIRVDSAEPLKAVGEESWLPQEEGSTHYDQYEEFKA